MNKRDIARIVYLSGTRIGGGVASYTVHTGSYDGLLAFDVPTARIGHAFVRTLRALAEEKPDRFPPSARDGSRNFSQ